MYGKSWLLPLRKLRLLFYAQAGRQCKNHCVPDTRRSYKLNLLLFIASLILSVLMKKGFFIGISVSGIFMREIIDIAVSFYNLRHYGYVIGRYAIMRKDDDAVWQFIL